VIYDFRGGALGYNPIAGLVMDAAQNLYGTTSLGGYYDKICDGSCGTVFELTPGTDGKWSYKVLHEFHASDGYFPSTSLILDAAGNLFGTTPYGGTCGGNGCGVVFELVPGSGGKWNESVLYSFPCIGGCKQGGVPSSGVIFDSSGNLYGTTNSGDDGPGEVFELSPSSGGAWTENVLYTFCAKPHCADGDEPSGVIFDQAGNLYGVTLEGGTKEGYGVAFELSLGVGGVWTESVLYRFRGRGDGLAPNGSLVLDAALNLYGVTFSGGTGRLCPSHCGTVFELTKSAGGHWSEKVVHNFLGGNDGFRPSASLIVDGNGNLYGTTAMSFNGGGTVFELNPSSGGWTETVHNFWETDGAVPGSLTFDGSGNLYGTTAFGGAHGFGSVFKLAPTPHGAWQRIILYSFKGGTDVAYPNGTLVFDDAGNLYGTTQARSNQSGGVFELMPVADGQWTDKVPYDFKGSPDGYDPMAGVVFDSAGNLYGTTWAGGSNGSGTVFELTPSSGGNWVETVLYSFSGGADGGSPQTDLTWDAAGNLYGTTTYDGSGSGVVFELSPSTGGTWNESVLYSFTGGEDGRNPFAGVIFDYKGNLYGTTNGGGLGSCAYGYACGVVFKLSPQSGNTWKESVIYNFPNSANANPVAELVFDSAGNLYGTASSGANSNTCCGTVFKLAPTPGGDWKETTLHRFTGGKDGATPESVLVLDSAGNLYGTTSYGGTAGDGVLFEVTP